jgi:hypothetical protein
LPIALYPSKKFIKTQSWREIRAMKLKGTLALFIAVALSLASTFSSMAQGPPGENQAPQIPVLPPNVKATYVHLGNGEPGLLYEPTSPGEKASIGVFVMHASGDYLTFSACTQLSMRGYRVLCANNSTSKSGASDDGILDRVLLEARQGVVFLRNFPGIRKVVLWGHSGGATVMTAYQAIAENGPKFCQGPDKVINCPDSLAGMPPADGVMLVDPNWGQAEMTLLSIDPSVVDENTGMKQDPALDMFNPANGFVPTGSDYSPEFIRKFLSAEGRRNNELIAAAQERLKLIEAGKGLYLDDEPFIVPGATFTNNKLFSQDIKLLSRTVRPWPLIHPDGSITTQIVQSVRPPENTQNPARYMMRGALKTTVRNFLSSYAVKVTGDFGYDESSIHGVIWDSSYSSPPGNAEGITVPFLALGMSGHWEGLSAEVIYDNTKSTDKTLAFVEGATHMYTPCTKCEKYPGQFGDTEKTAYDFADKWLGKPGRFLQ